MKFQLQCCGDRAARSRAEAAETRTFRSASALWPTFRIKKLFLLKQLSPKKINIWAIYSRAHSYMPYINFDFLPPLTRISRVLMFSLYCHSLGRVCPSRVWLWDSKKPELKPDPTSSSMTSLNWILEWWLIKTLKGTVSRYLCPPPQFFAKLTYLRLLIDLLKFVRILLWFLWDIRIESLNVFYSAVSLTPRSKKCRLC